MVIDHGQSATRRVWLLGTMVSGHIIFFSIQAPKTYINIKIGSRKPTYTKDYQA